MSELPIVSRKWRRSRARSQGALAASLLAAILVLLSWTTPTHASPDTEACLSSAEHGELEKKRGALARARTTLGVCASDDCPAPVRAMCRLYLDEIGSMIPTLEITARDDHRKVLDDVRITIDDIEAAADGDGTFAVDPGTHVVRVRHGTRIEEAEVEVAVGQKRTPVAIVFTVPVVAERPAAAARRPSSVDTAAPESRRTRSFEIAPWIAGGLGLAALGGAGVFGVRWLGATDCKPGCSPSEVDDIQRNALVADVLVGVGVVALGVATALFLSTRTTRTARSAAPAIVW